MADDTSICNSAAVRLGIETIVDINDVSSDFARKCKIRLPEVRDSVLEMHPWNCATKRTTLSPLVDSPAFGYKYKFQLPSDCIRVIFTDNGSEYKLESSRNILSDDSVININYVARIEDPNDMTPLLRECVGAYLAYDLSFSINQGENNREALLKAFMDLLRKAKTVDSQSDGRSFFKGDHYLIARRSSNVGYTNIK